MNTLDVHEAAALAKCHPDTMRRLMKAGEVPGCKVGRAWVVSENEFQKWLDNRCRYTAVPEALSGGSALVAALESQLARKTERKPRNTRRSSVIGSGDERSSETVVRFPGKRS